MIKYFWVTIIAIFLLSTYNWYEEGHGNGFILSNIGAIFGSALSTVIYMLEYRSERTPVFPVLISTSSVVILSFIIYLYYALNGKAGNGANSAAHMHIILMPIFLTIYSIIVSFIALFVSYLVRTVKNRAS